MPVARPGDRPLRLKTDRELAALYDQALTAADGIAGAHCIHERWMRGEFPAHIESALDQLWKRAGASVPDWLPMRYISWLSAVYEVAARFTAVGGRSNIYLILLDAHPRLDDLRAQGGDPDAWLDDMSAEGFVESPLARTNYNVTTMAVASMFSG